MGMTFANGREPSGITPRGVAKVARRRAFGKGASPPAGAFPRRFTGLSQAERAWNRRCHSGAENPQPPEMPTVHAAWPAAIATGTAVFGPSRNDSEGLTAEARPQRTATTLNPAAAA
jgi:hypothetical protein